MALDPLYLATAVEAALSAGAVQRTYFRREFRVSKKGPIDLVTEADVEVERAFRRLIAGRFPDHQVLGEEDGIGTSPGSARHRWIVDPIDGTTNFAHGLALFCVSIALEIDGQVALGVVYDPIGEELYTAERGEGARLNGTRLAVSSCTALIDALLCTGFPYSIQEERGEQVRVFGAFLGHARAVRRLGSAALDLCYLAAGRFDGFWEERLHPWDIAAAALIAEEAGGRVTDYDGGPYELSGRHIVVSNGGVHEAMLAVIRQARGPAGLPG